MDDEEFIYRTLVAAATAHRSGFPHMARGLVQIAIDAHITSRGEMNVTERVLKLRIDMDNESYLFLQKLFPT